MRKIVAFYTVNWVLFFFFSFVLSCAVMDMTFGNKLTFYASYVAGEGSCEYNRGLVLCSHSITEKGFSYKS